MQPSPCSRTGGGEGRRGSGAGPNRGWYVVGDMRGRYRSRNQVAVEVAVAIEVAIVVAGICRPHGVTNMNTDTGTNTDTECLQDTQGARVGHTVLAAWDETRYCSSCGRLGVV